MVSTGETLLSGAPNFRSMGGIAVSGGRIRDGVLYRSGAFAGLTPADHAAFGRLGVRTVVDLRRDSERADEPTGVRLAPGGRIIAYSLVDAVSAGAGTDYFVRLLKSPDGEGALAVMRELYMRLPHALHGWLGTALAELGDDASPPVVIHCAAGKDRTGVFCAVLLHAMGAGREAIVADYVLSNGRYPPARHAAVERLVARATGIADCAPVSTVLNAARAEFIETALDEIERTWGSLDVYLEAAGVGATLRETLRERYVTKADAAPSLE